MSLSLVAYGDSSDSDSEEEAAPRVADRQPSKKEDVRKLLSVLPPPKRGRGGKGPKQPVRIGLPKLEKGDDSDEEDTPTAKKPKVGGSGLTAILPKPKGGPRELGASKKMVAANPMVPYTLMKKKREEKKPQKLKRPGKVSKKGSDESDSDEEPVSFFPHLEGSSLKPSHPETSSHDTYGSPSDSTAPQPSFKSSRVSSSPAVYATPTVTPLASINTESTPLVSELSVKPVSHQTFGESTSYEGTTGPGWYQYTHQHPSQYSVQGYTDTYNASLQGYASGYGTSQQTYGSGYGASAQVYTPGGPDPSTQGYMGGQYGEVLGGASVGEQEVMPGPGPGLSIDEEALRRLAGGKKRKKREESLNDIIDIKEDDVKEGIRTYQKYHTEDSVNKLYAPDLAKMKTPTGAQKRKHQLSYLAHQAKARELELRNHWAQSAATKRQTQMKYGF